MNFTTNADARDKRLREAGITILPSTPGAAVMTFLTERTDAGLDEFAPERDDDGTWTERRSQ